MPTTTGGYRNGTDDRAEDGKGRLEDTRITTPPPHWDVKAAVGTEVPKV